MLSVETEMLTCAESGDQNRTLQGHKTAWSAGKGGRRDVRRGLQQCLAPRGSGQTCALALCGSASAALAPCRLVAPLSALSPDHADLLDLAHIYCHPCAVDLCGSTLPPLACQRPATSLLVLSAPHLTMPTCLTSPISTVTHGVQRPVLTANSVRVKPAVDWTRTATTPSQLPSAWTH